MRLSPRPRSWSVVLAAALLAMVSPHASARPIEASASAEVSEGEAARARERAIAEARRGALEQALDSIEITKDDAAVAGVIARPEAWTAAYRVLEVATSSARVDVRVEVEVDVPRLRKRVAKVDKASRAEGFVLRSPSVRGCAGVDLATLAEPLRAYGIVADSGDAELSLTVACQDRGAVMHTHVQAAKVEIAAKVTGAVALEARVEAQGFASDASGATTIALDRALGELADELAVAARGDLELYVEQPWPAARITALERTLRESVLGVDSVELAGIAADGAAILRVGGSIEAKALGRALMEASFSGFALVGLRIDGAHALRVRLQ